MNDGDKLKLLIELLKVSQRDFSEAISKSETVISGIIAGRRSIGGNLAKDIKHAFPQVSLDWLLAGEGMPIKDARLGSSNKELINEINYLKHKVEEYQALSSTLLAKSLQFEGSIEEAIEAYPELLKEMEESNAVLKSREKTRAKP